MHMMHRLRARDHRGASAVEFALVVPLLLLILFAIINFGLLFAQNLALSNAARQAARFGIVAGDAHSCSAVASEGSEAAKPLLPSGVSATVQTVNSVGTVVGNCSGVEKACALSAPDTNVKVTLTYTADVAIANFIPGLGATKQLTGTGVFRCEWS